MSCKYDIIDEGGRKRVRALRPFTVQGRDVCPMELGGYVYDANTLSQEGNCWIFSGSLEYPGVRVLDEAIVDMGSNLPKSNARPKSVIISGNSRIMGAISFESAPVDVLQTPAMFEQGTYNAVVGKVPVKGAASIRVRIPVPVFCGTVGAVAITSTAYEARIISLNEDGIIVSATAWTVGGPAVTLTSTAPYILVEVRKVGETAISPTDITAAGITVTRAREATLRIFNSSIVPVYNGVVTLATSILRISSVGTGSLFNCSMRAECVYNQANSLLFESDATKTNFFLTLSGGNQLAIRGFKLRNTNFYSRQSLPTVGPQGRVIFDVSDCPAFTYDPGTFPAASGFLSSGKTFYFKNCNMPAGSALHYYDPNVNVWDNIDFTKAMADLGKALPAQATLTMVSSNKQGWYRVYGINSNSHGALVESLSSISSAIFSTAKNTYDTIIHKDHTITGAFEIIGRNVFGGTLGGASKITNTAETAMVIDGNFRIEGNAQVTDTPLKGTGYVGGNAEIKNGNILGYVYMDGNSKVDLPVNTSNFRRLIMRGSPKITKIRPSTALSLEMYGNALLNAELVTGGGGFIMRDNSVADSSGLINVQGRAELRDNASITGTSALSISGDVELIGGYNQTTGSLTITGKRVISDVSQIEVVDVPPTKTTW